MLYFFLLYFAFLKPKNLNPILIHQSIPTVQAAKTLAEEVEPAELDAGRLYPRLSHIRPVTLSIASKLCDWFYRGNMATYKPEPKNKYDFLKNLQYNPVYDDSYSK